MLLLGALGALAAPGVIGHVSRETYGSDRRNDYEALVEALLEHGALPGAPADARAAGDRLSVLYADSLPARRREINGVLDELRGAKLAQRDSADRIRLLREWVAAGGQSRARAARATALAAAAFGPADRPLPVVI